MTVSMHDSLLDHFPILSLLSSDELHYFNQAAQHKIIKKYSYIYAPNDPSLNIYFIEKGQVKLFLYSDEGRELIKVFLQTSDIFGGWGLIGEDTHKEYAMSHNEAVHLYTIPTHQFNRILRSNAEFRLKIISHFGKRVMETEKRLSALQFESARSRIIQILRKTVLEQGYPPESTLAIKVTLTQQEIGNYACTSRQTVAQVLNDLKASNLIKKTRKGIIICNLQALK